MPKFRNKKNKKVIEENLVYYVKELRNSSDFEEIKEKEEVKENTSEDHINNNKEENNLQK